MSQTARSTGPTGEEHGGKGAKKNSHYFILLLRNRSPRRQRQRSPYPTMGICAVGAWLVRANTNTYYNSGILYLPTVIALPFPSFPSASSPSPPPCFFFGFGGTAQYCALRFVSTSERRTSLALVRVYPFVSLYLYVYGLSRTSDVRFVLLYLASRSRLQVGSQGLGWQGGYDQMRLAAICHCSDDTDSSDSPTAAMICAQE
eukprot:scaffold70726_cov34-Tisochrysis_lutea.AAC.3